MGNGPCCHGHVVTTVIAAQLQRNFTRERAIASGASTEIDELPYLASAS